MNAERHLVLVHLKPWQCIDGYLYLIHSRNGRIGVCHSRGTRFMVVCEEFGRKYLDYEWHYDVGGTVVPIRPLVLAPIFAELDYFKEMEKCSCIMV